MSVQTIPTINSLSLFLSVKINVDFYKKNCPLRPAGGVNHPDSVSAKVGKLAAKKALR